MWFKNARVIFEDGVKLGSLSLSDGRIGEFVENPPEKVDAIDLHGDYLAPGVVDLHTHGSGGFDVMDGSEEDIKGAADSLLLHGSTSVLLTTLTSSDEELFLFLDNYEGVKGKLKNCVGLHLEGPYFSESEKGAQDSKYIRLPSRSHWSRILERGRGNIRRWSLAPELPSSIEMIRELSRDGILLSAGHTAATYDEISRAYDAGLRLLTHFYSGMSSIRRVDGYRVLGTVEAGYLIDGLNLELIGDGAHLPYDLLKLIFKCKNNREITICSDSMRGAGMAEGRSILGSRKNGLEVIIEDGIAKMVDHSGFAGSVATGERLIKTLYKLGKRPEEIFYHVSLRPAELIGLDSKIGSIKAGKDGDLLVLDKSFNLKNVYSKGVKIR